MTIAALLAVILDEEAQAEAQLNAVMVASAPVNVPSGAPVFVSAEIGNVDAQTVAVTFDTNITAADYAAGVTIKVNTVSQTIASATRQANHALVYYVIPAAVFGDVITWEYTGGNIASEADASLLETVTAQTVTNNVLGDDVMLSITVTLTNAQIKALPTTPVEVIPAPGVGKCIYAQARIGNGEFLTLLHGEVDYTNVDAAVSIKFITNLSNPTFSAYPFPTGYLAWSGGNPLYYDVLFAASNDSISQGATFGDTLSNFENEPLYVGIDNGILGDLTGGDAANTLAITIFYAIVNV